MEFSIIDIFMEAGFVGTLILSFNAVSLFYFFYKGKTHIIMFFLILSGSFVGASDPLIAAIAPIGRWIAVFFMLLYGVLYKKWIFSLGSKFFLIYVFFGILFLFRAYSFDWQLQRSILLLVVTLGILLAYGNEDFRSSRLSLLAISFAGTIFVCINLILLINSFGDGLRFSGILKGAPAFAMVIAGFLPFLMFSVCNNEKILYKFISAIGLGIGIISLVFSGQRAGTIGGAISLLPFFLLGKLKIIIFNCLILVLGFSIIYFFSDHIPWKELKFLENRYSEVSGLSNRDEIWGRAFEEIEKSPIFGAGIGASEQIIESSFHQTFLEIWFNAGMPGLIFYFATILYCGYRIIQMYEYSNKDRERLFHVALSSGYLLSFLAMGIVESLGAAASNNSMVLFLFIMVMASNSK